MTEFQTTFTLIVFAAVILAIAFDVVDMVLAALLGVAALLVVGVFAAPDGAKITHNSGGPIALLFGGMIVAGVLAPTGLFDWVGTRYLRFTRGSGKRFLIGLVVLVGALCAVLPNATTVVLLAPVIIRVARELDIDIVPPMILTAIVSNTAGLLTLVGDPATFLVGSSIGMSFGEYLQKVSLGGLLTLLALTAMLPWLMRDIWNLKRELPAELPPARITRPVFATVALLVLAVMVLLFLFGEDTPTAITPPAVAIVAAALALLVVQAAKVEPVGDLLKRVDWKTLLFLVLLFALVEAFNKTGILQSFSNQLYEVFGTHTLIVALVMLVGVGLASTLLANIPVVAAMLFVAKSYLIIAELVPEQALDPTFANWPAATLPLFVAMMFGGTLGGNATLIGASANVVSVGICAQEGRPVSFVGFMRYGVPVVIVQLAISALYVLALDFLITR
ncbi:MAG: Citrate transporter [Burkholderiaceae bacterium]|jgi:Na+/H+ antiporter NhaD/arsenite permease-like protein|nr:Citrate transporter [Burkholderiaceae bacterium]